MKRIAVAAAVALCVAGLGAASRRLANHQAVLPEVNSRINTRVIRINQHKPMPSASRTGSVAAPRGEELP